METANRSLLACAKGEGTSLGLSIISNSYLLKNSVGGVLVGGKAAHQHPAHP